jgi:hypothetical protein
MHRPWLKEKVYDAKRKRTIDLVKSSIDALLKDRRPVSLASVVARSRQIDPAQRGISETAILHNQGARSYYQQHRSWRTKSGKRPGKHAPHTESVAALIKADRNIAHVRYKYLKLSKAELVERLLVLEQAHASLQENWLRTAEEVMEWRLRAERAEAQCDHMESR